MGLRDIVSTVLTEYKVDVKDAKRELKGLSEAEKRAAQSRIDSIEKSNSAIDTQLSKLAKLGIAVGATAAAYKVLSDGVEVYQRNARLAAATVGADLAGLQKATAGLVEETQLLEFASKAMNGTFKLTQSEMERVLQGALAMRKTLGNELPVSMERLTKAVTEANVEGLKELGLTITGPDGKVPQAGSKEGLIAILRAMDAEVAKLGGKDGSFALAGDDAGKASVKFNDAMDRLKESLGKIAVALAPIVELLARVVDLMAQALDFSDLSLQGTIDKQRAKVMAGRPTAATADFGAVGAQLAAERRAQIASGAGTLSGFASRSLGSLVPGFGGGPSAPAGRSGGGGYQYGGQVEDGGNRSRGTFYTGRNQALEFADANDAQTRLAIGNAATSGSESIQQLIDQFAALDAAKRQAGIDEKRGALAAFFGTPAEIDATTEALMRTQQVFDGLANAFGAGVGALIDGSKSFSEAFKDALGQTLKNMSMEMAVRALREAAMGIAALTSPLTAGTAPGHFKAAAAYGFGATMAGVYARAMGVGAPSLQQQSPSAGAGTAGVGSSGLGSGGGDTTSTRVYILDGSLGGQSPRLREANIRKSMRQAGVKIDGDVVFDG